jgi:hypothetical protein
MKIKKEIKNICFQFIEKINYIAKMGGLRKVF